MKKSDKQNINSARFARRVHHPNKNRLRIVVDGKVCELTDGQATTVDIFEHPGPQYRLLRISVRESLV